MESSGTPQFIQPNAGWQYGAPPQGVPPYWGPTNPYPGIPEGATQDYFASWGRRAVALITDAFIPTLLFGILVLGMGLWFNSTVGGVTEDSVVGYVFLGLALYLVGLMIVTLLALAIQFYCFARKLPRRGQSFGKQAVGVRIERIDGTELRVSDFWMRHFVPNLIGAATGGIFFIVDYAWPLFDDRRQALRDKMADTIVVDLRSELAGGKPEPIATPGPVFTAAVLSIVLGVAAVGGGVALFESAEAPDLTDAEIERAFDKHFEIDETGSGWDLDSTGTYEGR